MSTASGKSRQCPNCGQRFTGQRAYILHLLDEAGPDGITNNELMHAGSGSRYSARILELRDQGYGIASEKVSENVWLYRRTGDSQRITAPAPDPTEPVVPVYASGRRPWAKPLTQIGPPAQSLPPGLIEGPEVPLERTTLLMEGKRVTCITVDLRREVVAERVKMFTERRTAA